MPKYDQLRRYLGAQGGPETTPSFDEIEQIIGVPLRAAGFEATLLRQAQTGRFRRVY